MKWDKRFLALASHVSSWSKDPSTQVGAVVVSPQGVVCGIGYNGFPRGVEDRQDRLDDRAVKYPMTVHAEPNAILTASQTKGCTLYVHPLSPCATCAGFIIQAGICRVVFPAMIGEEALARWKFSFELSEQMFSEAGVEVSAIHV